MLKVIEWSEGMDVEKAAPCLIKGMPNDAYHAGAGMNKSSLDKISKSPAHFKFAKAKETKAMGIGAAAHCAVLEPHLFDDQYLLLPEVPDRRAREYKEAAKTGKRVLVGNEVAQIVGIKRAVFNDYFASALLRGESFYELSAFGFIDGVLCKARFDCLVETKENGVYAVDLKTTKNARPKVFESAVAEYRYHVQAAFYSDVFEAATGAELAQFWFIAVESDLPHGVISRYLDEASFEQGRTEYQKNLRTYRECIESDSWPCYEQPLTEEDCEMSLPEWYWNKLDNEELEGLE